MGLNTIVISILRVRPGRWRVGHSVTATLGANGRRSVSSLARFSVLDTIFDQYVLPDMVGEAKVGVQRRPGLGGAGESAADVHDG
jgi:hypothetical protein